MKDGAIRKHSFPQYPPNRQSKCSIYKSDENKTLKINNKLKTNSKLTITSAFLFAFGEVTACRTKPETKNNATNQSIVQTVNNTKSPENIKMDIEPSDDSSTSPTAAYKAALTARKKKDLNDLKKVLSKKMLGFL